MEAMDMEDPAVLGPADQAQDEAQEDSPQKVKELIGKITRTIKVDLKHHEDAFKRMKRDMFVVRHGREEDWSENNYSANIVGRHIKQKTAALYAKNPKAIARRRETLDFVIWDENPQSLMLAFQTVQAGTMAAQAAQAGGPVIDEFGNAVTPEPQLPPGFDQARAVLEDFQQGTTRRQEIEKLGKTLEILFANAVREQKPLDFKTALKQTVRRTCTTGVGYIELGFQREMGPSPITTSKLADARGRLDHLKRLAEEAAEEEITNFDAEMAELEAGIAALQAEPEIVLREGLIFDFPRSTKVIPDRLCKSLVGFIGARHLTIEYDYTVDEIEEMFGVDMKKAAYTPYGADGCKSGGDDQPDLFDGERESGVNSKEGLVRVWKHYDKPSGLVYYIADGFDEWLREPAAPDVFVEDFWPVYALTFNDVEDEKELFPPSDVSLMLNMQREYNRSRQGMREHRQAARPRWVYSNGAFTEEDIDKLAKMKPFSATGINKDPQAKILDLLQVMPVPGVDPNLYETGQLFTDIQLVVGTQEAQLGGLAKATATESAIAASASSTADGSNSDDLDGFLTAVARSSGQILLREMSEEQVKKIAGEGAFWPQMSLADIAGEVFLEVEAGSTGKPNQAVEMNNWKTMLPFLLQMPGIEPTWLARESLRRLDDRMDLTAALASGIPSIMAMNAQKQLAPQDPGNAPDQQGAKGADNAPATPGGPTGSDAAFGSNQV